MVALVIHEYGHGIQMRAHGMRVRSFGLLIASLIPIGAFAEPEAREISQAPIRERMRTYAAGPAVNLVFAALLTIALASTMMNIEPHNEGAYSPAIILDGPADTAGLRPYDIIVNVENTSIEDASAFKMNSLKQMLVMYGPLQSCPTIMNQNHGEPG